MPSLEAVPYENFMKLQVLLGEPLANIMSVSRDAGVPCPPMKNIGKLRNTLVDGLPEDLQKEVLTSDFSMEFVENHFAALREANWPDISHVLHFFNRQAEFDVALSHFMHPELRLRMDCLILSKQCSPTEIAEAIQGWSKSKVTKASVEVYSYYFCNMEVMDKLKDWREYMRAFDKDDYKYFLAQAFDVQTRTDLVVLLSDLSIRSSITVNAEESVRDLMRMAFVQIKKEERKISRGVPAQSTSIFEWSGVYCSMFDRVLRVEDAGNREDAIESIQTKLVRAKRAHIRPITEFDVTSGEELAEETT